MGTRSSNNKHVYNSKLWKELRQQRLLNEPLCRIHKRQGKLVVARHVDHITPIEKGGDPYDYDNTQSLCPSCHSLKTRQDEGHIVNWGCDVHGNPLDSSHHWH